MPDEELLGTQLARLDQKQKAADVFPELRDLLPGLPTPEPVLEAEAARFRLFEALTATYRRLATEQPVVLVLDDLHWADAATLLLLQHVAAEVAGSRLMLLGTYRDGDVDREHPFSGVLAELNRLPGFQLITLHALSEQETAEYVRQTVAVAPAADVERRIYEATEGNPFFTRELVHLLSEGELRASGPQTAIPLTAGVRAVLGRHLERLKPETHEFLRTAAIVGREFTHESLSLLAESGRNDLVSLLEEAIILRVVEATEEPGRYRFVHALMQEALLADLAAPRRALLHGEVAEALERRWGDRAGDYAARLAHHFGESAVLTPENAEKGLQYSRLTGEQAEAQYAWDEAARHYERCLSLFGPSGEGPANDEAALLEAVGRCEVAAARYRAGWRSLRRAVDLYGQLGDWSGMARCTLAASYNWVRPERALQVVEQALAAPGERDPRLEARLLAWRAGNPQCPADERERDLAYAREKGANFPEVLAAIANAEALIARTTFG